MSEAPAGPTRVQVRRCLGGLAQLGIAGCGAAAATAQWLVRIAVGAVLLLLVAAALGRALYGPTLVIDEVAVRDVRASAAKPDSCNAYAEALRQALRTKLLVAGRLWRDPYDREFLNTRAVSDAEPLPGDGGAYGQTSHGQSVERPGRSSDPFFARGIRQELFLVAEDAAPPVTVQAPVLGSVSFGTLVDLCGRVAGRISHLRTTINIGDQGVQVFATLVPPWPWLSSAPMGCSQPYDDSPAEALEGALHQAAHLVLKRFHPNNPKLALYDATALAASTRLRLLTRREWSEYQCLDTLCPPPAKSSPAGRGHPADKPLIGAGQQGGGSGAPDARRPGDALPHSNVHRSPAQTGGSDGRPVTTLSVATTADAPPALCPAASERLAAFIRQTANEMLMINQTWDPGRAEGLAAFAYSALGRPPDVGTTPESQRLVNFHRAMLLRLADRDIVAAFLSSSKYARVLAFTPISPGEMSDLSALTTRQAARLVENDPAAEALLVAHWDEASGDDPIAGLSRSAAADRGFLAPAYRLAAQAYRERWPLVAPPTASGMREPSVDEAGMSYNASLLHGLHLSMVQPTPGTEAALTLLRARMELLGMRACQVLAGDGAADHGPGRQQGQDEMAEFRDRMDLFRSRSVALLSRYLGEVSHAPADYVRTIAILDSPAFASIRQAIAEGAMRRYGDLPDFAVEYVRASPRSPSWVDPEAAGAGASGVSATVGLAPGRPLADGRGPVAGSPMPTPTVTPNPPAAGQANAVLRNAVIAGQCDGRVLGAWAVTEYWSASRPGQAADAERATILLAAAALATPVLRGNPYQDAFSRVHQERRPDYGQILGRTQACFRTWREAWGIREVHYAYEGYVAWLSAQRAAKPE